MSSRKYVALKVVKGSLEYDQFSQLCILNHVHVYIIHFVGRCCFLFIILCLLQWNLYYEPPN